MSVKTTTKKHLKPKRMTEEQFWKGLTAHRERFEDYDNEKDDEEDE